MFANCIKSIIQPATWAVFGEKVDVLGRQVSHRGTAFALDAHGTLLTCWHVTFMDKDCQEECDEFVVVQPELGAKKYSAKLIVKDRDRDLALLQIEGAPPTRPVKLAQGEVPWGRSCCAFGHPLTVTDPVSKSFRLFSCAASGIVSTPTRHALFHGGRPIKGYELDFFTHGGSSGGAIFLRDGTVIGSVHGSRLLDDGKGNQVRSNLTIAISVEEAVELVKPFNIKLKFGGGGNG